jgi:hypothetical protein
MEGNYPDFIKIIPNSPIDDFFFWGFIAGIIGYLYYVYVSRNDPKNHLNAIAGIYGTILSGSLGGLLAIVFDKNIAVSIIVGLLNQLIYMALIRSVKSGDFWQVVKEVLIRYLTAGKV